MTPCFSNMAFTSKLRHQESTFSNIYYILFPLWLPCKLFKSWYDVTGQFSLLQLESCDANDISNIISQCLIEMVLVPAGEFWISESLAV